MPAGFNGKIELDIRDSEPDWDAVPGAEGAAEGAPNVLLLAWDDLGYATMDTFGGPVRVPEHGAASPNVGVTFSNFHTTALCSPTRASLLTGRNATTNGMATIAEFASGFPGISTRIPFENGFISEVLAEHGYNTYCVGKWHLTPGEECNLAAYKGRWPLGRGFERFYGWLGGETNSWYPDLVHDNHPIEPPGRPEDGYHLADDMADKAVEFIRDAKVIDPDKPFFMYLAPQAGHAPHLVPLEWADRYKGVFDEGYEAIRDGILERQIELGLLPEGTELSPINPHGEPEPHRPRRPALAAARHRPAVGLADRRREAAVHPDGRGVRRLHLLQRRPARPGARLPRGVRPARQHDHRRGLRQRRQRRGRPQRQRSTSGASSTASPTPPRPTLPHIDELGTPASNNHYNTGWAWAFDTPFPYWKRWAGDEGGVADMCLVSWPAKIAAQRRAAPPVRPRRRRRARRSTTCSASSRPTVIKGYPQSPIEGESFAAALTDPTAPGKRTQFYTMLGQRSIYHEGWLRLHRAPAARRAGATSSRTSGSSSTSRPTASQSHNLAAEQPERARDAEGPVVLLRRHLQRPAARRPHRRSSRCSPSGPTARPTATSTSSTRTAPTCPSRPGRRSPAARTRSPPASTVDSADVEGVIWAAGGVPGGHTPLRQGRRAALHVQLDRHRTCRTSSPTATLTPGRPRARGRVRGRRARARTRPCPAPPARSRCTSTTRRSGQATIVTQPGYFCLTGDGICVGRDSASAVTPEYQAPFPFTGGTIDKVVVDVTGEPLRRPRGAGAGLVPDRLNHHDRLPSGRRSHRAGDLRCHSGAGPPS